MSGVSFRFLPKTFGEEFFLKKNIVRLLKILLILIIHLSQETSLNQNISQNINQCLFYTLQLSFYLTNK